MFKTPHSPQELAFGQAHQKLGTMLDTGQFGEEAARERFGEIQPMFDDARRRLGMAHGVQTAAVGQNIGDALASAGVAKGHDTAGAFTTAMAPTISTYLDALSQLDIGEANTLMQLLETGDQRVLQLVQLMLASAGGMKGSTAAGDWLGALTTLAQVGGTVAGVATGNPLLVAGAQGVGQAGRQ